MAQIARLHTNGPEEESLPLVTACAYVRAFAVTFVLHSLARSLANESLCVHVYYFFAAAACYCSPPHNCAEIVMINLNAK
jgi:hypothetical protein